MNSFVLFAVVIFAAVTAAYLKKKNQELSLVFSIAVVLLVLFAMLENLFPIIDKVSAYWISNELYLAIPLKLLGLTILSKLTTSICDDAGEKGISSAVSAITKVTSVLIALPLFDELLAEIGAILAL